MYYTLAAAFLQLRIERGRPSPKDQTNVLSRPVRDVHACTFGRLAALAEAVTLAAGAFELLGTNARRALVLPCHSCDHRCQRTPGKLFARCS
jgi:hypothetical protein